MKLQTDFGEITLPEYVWPTMPRYEEYLDYVRDRVLVECLAGRKASEIEFIKYSEWVKK